MDIVDRINATKSLIFTVTPGRSGTKYLAALLGSVPGVAAHHEPQPDFVTALRRAQQDPEVAFAFWRDVKLPFIDFASKRRSMPRLRICSAKVSSSRRSCSASSPS